MTGEGGGETGMVSQCWEGDTGRVAVVLQDWELDRMLGGGGGATGRMTVVE